MRHLADFLWFVGEVFRDLSIRLHARAARCDSARRFERLCYGCSPLGCLEWQPMTRGKCQQCGHYAGLMAFKR